MAQLLVVDHEPVHLEALADLLASAGHRVATAPDGRTALAQLRTVRPGAVVVDVDMPLMDGFTFCRHARADGDVTPILLLSARNSDGDVVTGLGAGADDYVTRPCAPEVLFARIEALLRRATLRRPAAAAERESKLVEVGALRLDATRLEATWHGKPLALTVTEFRLLELLARHPGTVFSRANVLQELRGEKTVVAPRLVDTYVRRLRRVLEKADPSFASIETIIGAGYRWIAESAASAEPRSRELQ